MFSSKGIQCNYIAHAKHLRKNQTVKPIDRSERLECEALAFQRSNMSAEGLPVDVSEAGILQAKWYLSESQALIRQTLVEVKERPFFFLATVLRRIRNARE